jgi:hypothetical protein
MSDSWWPWILRVLWLLLPFVAGPLFGDALEDTSRPVQVTATIGLWVVWSAGLVLSAIPHTVTLTPMRIIAPATFAGAIWATLADGASGTAVIALAATAAVAVVALAAPVGAWFVNGSSYGDERRVPLRAPTSMLAGPIPITWALTVAGAAAVPMLFAARQWLLGAIVLVVSAPIAIVGVRALHGLAGRWLVFVPAGVVVHDPFAVPDPVLFKRSVIRAFGPALADTTATDLTMGASGLALEIQVGESVEIAHRPSPGAEPVTTELEGVLVAPSRPGAVLAEAAARRIRVA